ncbi:chemotaxis protein CheW [Desulfocurvibacter africanus]|uniref:chemotaxis protein CheW n=1 Tax=Desulfocurvibacter africanus TaxID=873 RepID=UPI002FD9AE84
MSEHAVSSSSQYLTFTLADEVFALDISTVREVLELPAITRVPRMPADMRGVINLRGQGVPVIDLRRKFDLDCAKDTINTCIIIVETNGPEGLCVMGAIADSVREVMDIPPDAVMPAPKMGTAVRSDFIAGIGRLNDAFVIILNAERIFGNALDLDQQMAASPRQELADCPA